MIEMLVEKRCIVTLKERKYCHLNKEDAIKGAVVVVQLFIDKTVLRDYKRRHTNLAMAWIGYKKAYDMVPHSYFSE